MSLDTQILLWLNQLTINPFWRWIFLLIAVYGLGVYILVALWAWYHHSNHKEDFRLQRAVVLGVMSSMVALAVGQIIVVLLYRARPFMVIDQLTAYNVLVDSSSFPSMHTAVAAAFSISWLYAGFKRGGILLVILALLIGLARVVVGVHYPTDVLGGVLVGWLAAWAVWREAGWLKTWLTND